MAAPTTDHDVTARKLTKFLVGSDGTGGLWGKIKTLLAGKQDTLAAQTAYTSKGTATKVPQITTNSLGQVTGITEVTITGVTPASHTHGNIANGGTLTDTAAAAAGNDYVVIRDADNAKIQTSTIKGTDVADAVSKKHSHSTLTLSTTAQAYDGSHTLALPSTDPYTSARTPASHTHGNIANGGTLTDTAAAAAGNDYVVIRDADNAKIQTSTIKGTDVADAVSKKHSHSTLTLSTTAQAYDGSHTLALPSTDPYTSARTPASHTHGNIANGGTLTDTAAAAAGNDYVIIRDADNAKIQTSTIKGTDVADAVSKKHSHSTLTLSTTAQAYDGTHTLALPSTDPYTSARTPASHTHGNIQNGGTLQTTDVTIASGDKLVITDSSDSNKVARASISFDGSTATKALTQKGTWETFNNYTHPAYTATTAAAKKIGCDATGHVVFGDALAKGDVGLGSVVNTGDSATPVSGGTTKFTTGGAYTELAKKANVAESVYYVAGTTSYSAWTANTAYAVNAEVTYGGKAYYCKTAHTSGSSWDSSKWTAIATPVLKGTVSGVTALYAGMKIAYKWPITGGSSSTYLNINGLGNVYIRRNDSNTTTHLPANTVSILTYDGTYWRWADYDSNSNTEYIIPDAYCSTAAGTAAKAATCVGFNLTNHVNVPFRIYFTVANTSAGALTLSLNSQTAKPIYINGTASSATNYTIPIGVYWCVYDGTEFLLWTDKRFTGRTQGDGRNLLSAFNYSASRFTATNPSDDINGASYTHNKVTGDSYIQIKATEPIATGEMLTLSFDVSGLNTSGNEYASFLAYALNKVITHTINKNGRCVYYFTKTETADITTGSVVNILDDNTNIYASAPSGITISNIKLERGFVADPKYTRHPSESRVAKADKIAASAKIGDTNKPVYIAADGTVTAGSTYAAGTAVTLNGTSKSATTASFYAPTGAGTSGQLLKSSGSGAPTWATANAALVGITVTSTSVSDGTNTFNKYTHPTYTAQSAKGSATKVPQITTDSTGHVTGITEVTITGVTPASHSHGNIANGGTLTDTAAAAAGNDYVVIRDADDAKIQTSTIKGTDVADAVSKKHSHSNLTLSTTAQAYDGTHTLALPSTDPYTSARTPASHTHGNIANGGTLTDTAAAAAGNDYVVIRDADNAKIQTSTIKGTDVADAVSKKHSHSTLTLSTTAQAYDGSHTLALPSTDPYTSARTPASHTHGNITNGGGITATGVDIANGDALVIVDSSDTNKKVAKTSITFDGTTTTKALTPKGTFESFAKSSDIPAAVSVKGNAESSYRTGQVNLTPANLGISATTSSVTVGSTTFNNTDTKVTQTNTDTSSNAQYRLLMSSTADDTTRTEGARKSTYAWFNPSTQTLGSQKFNVAGGCTMQYNSSTMSLDFVF